MEKYISPELPVVGSIVQAVEEDGIEPNEGFDGTCTLRLRCDDEGNWNIVNEDGGLICFLDKRYVGRRIYAVKIEAQRKKAVIGRPTHYDLPKCYCPGGNDPDCTGWRHWFHMSTKAKKLLLKSNPSFDDRTINHPPYIPCGSGYWEAMAEKESTKQGGKTL